MCARKEYTFFYVNFVRIFVRYTHKVLDDMDWVFWLYILNTMFLLLDMYLYWIYKDNKAPVTSDEINEEVQID